MKKTCIVDDSKFLLLKTDGVVITKGWHCDQPGVMIMEITKTDILIALNHFYNGVRWLREIGVNC